MYGMDDGSVNYRYKVLADKQKSMKEEGEISDDDSDVTFFDLQITAKNANYKNVNNTKRLLGSYPSSGQVRTTESPPVRNRPPLRRKWSPVRQNQLSPVRRTRFPSPQRHRSPSPRRRNQSPVRRGRIPSPVRPNRTLARRNRSPVFFTTKRTRDTCRNRDFGIGGYWDAPPGRKIETSAALDNRLQQSDRNRKGDERDRHSTSVTGVESRLPMLRGRFASKSRYSGLIEELVEEQKLQSSSDDASAAQSTDPEDFEDLLLKYRQIQERLAALKEEETYVVERSQDHSHGSSRNKSQGYLSNTVTIINTVVNNIVDKATTCISEKLAAYPSSFIQSEPSTESCSSRLIIDESAENSSTDMLHDSKTLPPDSDSIMHDDCVATQKQNSTIDNSIAVSNSVCTHDSDEGSVSDHLNTSMTLIHSSPSHDTEHPDTAVSADDHLNTSMTVIHSSPSCTLDTEPADTTADDSDIQIMADDLEVREISTIVIDDDDDEEEDDDDLDELELRRVALASACGAWRRASADKNSLEINPQDNQLTANGHSKEIANPSSFSGADVANTIHANVDVTGTKSLNEHSIIDISNDRTVNISNKAIDTNSLNKQDTVNNVILARALDTPIEETDVDATSSKQIRKDLTPPKPNSIRELLERRKFEHDAAVKLKRSLSGRGTTGHPKMTFSKDSYSPTRSSLSIKSRSRAVRGASLARRWTSPKRHHSLSDDRQVHRSEIQHILTLDDPKEQVDRFLKLLSSQENKDIRKTAPKSLGRQSSLRQLRRSGDAKPPLLDNYDDVAMDIVSEDAQSPVLDPASVIDDFQLGFDLDFMFPQSSSVREPLMNINLSDPLRYNQLDWNYVPDTYNSQNMSSTTTSVSSFPGQSMSYTDQLQFLPPGVAEPLNPPLPPEEELPPLPPEAPPPLTPPPPPEPHPEEIGNKRLNKVADLTGPLVNHHVVASKSGLDISSSAPHYVEVAKPEDVEMENDNDEDDDEEETLLLREQLLKSLAAKKQQQLKTAELASMKDESSPASSRGHSPSLLSRAPQQPVQRVEVRRKVAVPGAPNRSLVPVQQPLVISLGGADSSDSESEHDSPVKQSQESGQRLIGGLDSFIKKARRDVEEQKKMDSPKKKKVPTATLR